MFAAGDCAHAQLVVCAVSLASLASLIVIDADSGPLGPEGHSVSTPWERIDKEISFSELGTCR